MAKVRPNKYTTESFKKRVYELVGNEYTVLGDYVKSYKKILMRHNTCGHEYEVIASNFVNIGNRCPKCNSRNKVLEADIFKEKVLNQVGNEYSVLGEYVDGDTPILMRHNICGREWMIRPTFFVGKKRNRCPRCNRGKATLEDLKIRVKNKHSDRFTIISNELSHGYSDDIVVLDNNCDHQYLVKGNTLVSSNPVCPICAENKKKEKAEINTAINKKSPTK